MDMDQKISLKTLMVGEIAGKFNVPSYQRGFRWGESEVVRLLDDVFATEGNRDYYLQPIVVRKKGEVYDVIDGQQRLTTIYLIYKYIYDVAHGFYPEPSFTISYSTRENTGKFLNNLDTDKKGDNIDFWFISNAYECIEKWFEKNNKVFAIKEIYNYFLKNVKIIWYEITDTDDSESDIALFTRLNIGKIALTCAELVKAMFLSKDNNSDEFHGRQEEISLIWDNIEKDLHNESLWGFLTNRSKLEYPTRIDLVLDLIANKPKETHDVYYTFFKIDDMSKNSKLSDIWDKIQHTFLILKDWYEDHDYYHKIGYLIASGAKELNDIYQTYIGKTKEEFKNCLDDYIKQSVALKGDRNYSELKYTSKDDYEQITRILLLFNVLSVYNHGEGSQWFPFDRYKYDENGKVNWSLEHIHAQNSQGFNKERVMRDWLERHLKSIEVVDKENAVLIDSIKTVLVKEKVKEEDFKPLHQQIIARLSPKGDLDYLHTISNMALLKKDDNAALNNSTFDVKRNEVIDMDKRGKYIPFCTRMVFYKYYTSSEDNQLHFWGQADRDAYVASMNEVLKEYLTASIIYDRGTK